MWQLLALGPLIVCSGVVSGSETALFALDRRTLAEFATSTHRLRRLSATLMQHPNRVLLTVLIANTAINVAIFAVSFVATRNLSGGNPIWVTVGGVLALALVILGGEVLPKAIAYQRHRTIAPVVAPVLFGLELVLLPVASLLNVLLVLPLTRLLASPAPAEEPLDTESLRKIVELASSDGTISSQENEMLHAVLALGEMRVSEIMVPRVDIESVSLREGRSAIEARLRQSPRRKLPVYVKDSDDIVGVLYLRDLLLQPDVPVDRLVHPVGYVPEQITVMQMVRFFRNRASQMAIVVDEYGGTAGLVSVEDVLEAIVGEIHDPDETTETPDIEEIDETTFRISGDLSARTWADRFGIRLTDEGVDTVAGLILVHLGRLPVAGDSIRIDDMTLTVETMRGRRIASVLLTRPGAAGDTDGGAAGDTDADADGEAPS